MHGKLISPHNVRTDHTVLRSNLKIHQVWWYDWELHAEGHAMARYSSRHWLQWPWTVTAFCTAFCIVILLRIAKFRLERVSSSVGFNCPQSARSDSWQWLAAKQHRHFTPCLSLTSSDHHIYKSYMHMGSCWQSQVSTSQHVVFLLFACPRAMYPADDLILVTHSLKCLRSSMVVSSITEGCLLASHIRTAVNTLIDLSFCCINSLRGLLMLYLRHFVTLSLRHLPKCLCNLAQSRVLLAQSSTWQGQNRMMDLPCDDTCSHEDRWWGMTRCVKAKVWITTKNANVGTECFSLLFWQLPVARYGKSYHNNVCDWCLAWKMTEEIKIPRGPLVLPERGCIRYIGSG